MKKNVILALISLFFVSGTQLANAHKHEHNKEHKEEHIIPVTSHEGVKKNNNCANWDPRCKPNL